MDGIIPVNKPKGMTSYDVIRFMKRKFLLKGKIGHTGTLDPLASGVLILCIGKATKLSSKFMNMEKEYETRLLLGVATDSDDITGKIIKKREVKVKEKEIIKVIKKFEGEIEQIPPQASALKKNGQPLYKLYRKGIKVPPPPRKVFIKEIEIKNISLPYVDFRVVCSRGTYVRALCRDIGEKLGCGGTMADLCRKKIGNFKIENCVTLQDLEKHGLEKYLIPLTELKDIVK